MVAFADRILTLSGKLCLRPRGNGGRKSAAFFGLVIKTVGLKVLERPHIYTRIPRWGYSTAGTLADKDNSRQRQGKTDKGRLGRAARGLSSPLISYQQCRGFQPISQPLTCFVAGACICLLFAPCLHLSLYPQSGINLGGSGG